MRSTLRGPLAFFSVAVLFAALGPLALAQGVNPSTGSLGGYGAASSYSGLGMGGSTPMIIPYGGMFEGFMPSRMGGGGSLSLRSRPTAAMGSGRTSFSLAPMSGGMGRGLGARTRMASPFGPPGGMGLGGGMGRRAPGASGMGVMPPSLGYPFRQPPSLVPAPSSGSGMAM